MYETLKEYFTYLHSYNSVRLTMDSLKKRKKNQTEIWFFFIDFDSHTFISMLTILKYWRM